MKQKHQNWINKQKNELKLKIKVAKIMHASLSLLLLLINLTIIGLSIFAIHKIVIYAVANPEIFTELHLILATLSVTTIVVIFVIHFIIAIYLNVTQMKNYKQALDQMELELLNFHYNQGQYQSKAKEELLIKKIKKILNNVTSKKRVKINWAHQLYLTLTRGGK